MKRTALKALWAILAFVLVFSLSVGLGIIAAADEADIASGTAGEGLTWVISSDGTLTVSGNGEFDFEWYTPPWCEYSDQITSVRVEEGITEIPDTLFTDLNGVKSVYISSTVTHIGTLAFDNSFGIGEYIVAEENEHYKSFEGVIFTKDGALLVRFPSAGAMAEYTVPSDVAFIANEAFATTRNLLVINIGENVKSIGNNAFYNTAIQEINFESPTDTLASCLFSYAPITKFVVPDTVEYIQSSVFFDASLLETLVIGSGVKEIGGYFLYDTSSLSVVHYHGTADEWAAVNVLEGNEDLLQKEIHFVSYVEGYEAGCLPGHGGGLYCELCDEYLTGDVIPAIKDHTPGEKSDVINVPADCTENGYCYFAIYCVECEELMSENIAATDEPLGHSYSDGVCVRCGISCEHTDKVSDGACEICGLKYPVIELDVTATASFVGVEGSYVYVGFCPTESGYYMITSDNGGNDYEIDPAVGIVDADGYGIGYNDDDGDTYNFKLKFLANAGEYYLIFLEDRYGEDTSYEYTVTKAYGIESEPSSAKPELTISWNGADEYQWYEYITSVEITSENADSADANGTGGEYVEGKGWTSGLVLEYFGAFFKVELNAGDAIYLDFGQDIFGDIVLYGVENDYWIQSYDEMIEDGRIVLTAPFDDTYEVYLNANVAKDIYLRAYILEKVVLEDEVSKRLQSPRIDGIYSCDATVEGEVFSSIIFVYGYTVSHLPDDDEPYVEVNTGEASYEWYEYILGEEFTNENAEAVDWGNGATSYITNEGWSAVIDKFESEDSYDFVTVSLKAGQRVTVILYGSSCDGAGLYDYDSEDGTWVEYEKGHPLKFVFNITADGNYTVYTYSEDENIRARVYITDIAKIEGADTNTYYPEKDGHYRCDVTFENGKKTQLIAYLSAHEHIDENTDLACDVCGDDLHDITTGGGNTTTGSTNADADDDSQPTSRMDVIIVIALVGLLLVSVAFVIVKRKMS